MRSRASHRPGRAPSPQRSGPRRDDGTRTRPQPTVGNQALQRLLRGGPPAGRPLAPADRAFFEARFGRDFGGVRLHTGAEAAAAARAHHADALAAGRDIVFGAGAYAPSTPSGRHLLAHELAHVAQSAAARRPALPRTSDPADAAEREAEQAAATVAAGGRYSVREAPSARWHRKPADETKWWKFGPEDVPIEARKPENAKQATNLRKQVQILARPVNEEVERNTAKRILDGDVRVGLVDDLDLHPDQEGWIRDRFPAAEVADRLKNGRVLVHPRLGPAYIPNEARGFEAPLDPEPEVYVRWQSEDPGLVRTQLIHEVNHKVNAPEPERFDDPARQQAWAGFVAESRAYYVADYRAVTGDSQSSPVFTPFGDSGERFNLLDYDDAPSERRLAMAKVMALVSFPTIRAFFDTDADFNAAARAWKPTGNLDNTPLGP